eukprot:UN11212
MILSIHSLVLDTTMINLISDLGQGHIRHAQEEAGKRDLVI